MHCAWYTIAIQEMLGVGVINITFSFTVKETLVEKQKYFFKKIYVNSKAKILCSILYSN